MIAGGPKAIAEPPPLDQAWREPAATAAWAERLGGVSLMPGHVRLPRGTAVEELDGYDEGAWWGQILAASRPGRPLGDGAGKRSLDLCASPGGLPTHFPALFFYTPHHSFSNGMYVDERWGGVV